MSLQKKLNPDNLKDTLVEIRYSSGIPQELTLGFVLSVLAPLGFTYAPVPNQNFNISLNENQQVAFGFAGSVSGFFIKDKVRVQFINSQIAFNCIADNYVGWDNYSQIITAVIDNLLQKQIIRNFNRVSVRYISEFPNLEIFPNIKGNIDISQTGLKLKNSILRLVDESQNIKTVVSLTNQAKRVSQNQQIIEASLVDVNVFENVNPPINNLAELKTKLDAVHLKQKEIFFGLISDEFLQTLTPEY
jgi:uncharacterized protein (TIGR04255 family)